MSIMKFRKNPERPGAASVDGVVFNDDTVVAGERWSKWATQMFPGKPPVLVRAPDSAVVNAWHKEDMSAEVPKKPDALRAIISTVPVGERMKQEAEAKMKKVLAEEANKKAVKAEAPKPKAVKPAPKKAAQKPAPKPAPKKKPEPEDSGYELTDLPGVGESRAQALADAGYGSIGAVAKANVNELMEAIRETGGRVNMATVRAIVRAAKAML